MFRRKRKVSDFNAEIQAHLQLETERLQEQGLSGEQARAAARRSFGNLLHAEERFYEFRRWLWWDHFCQDIRYGVRMLRKSPAFTAIALCTIALGIGATTAIFSLVDATLLHSLPYPHPEQLVSVVDDLPGIGSRDVGISVPEWYDLERSGIFEYVAPVGGGDVNLTGSSRPQRIRFLTVSPNYFALLGVKPQLGHSFNPEDRTPGFTLEAIISDGLWKRGFGSNPNIVGKNLRLDNDLYHVIGVMPPGFHDPGRTPEERNNEIWVAAGFAADPAPPPDRKLRDLNRAIARIKSGLTLAQAQSRVDALVASLQQQLPDAYPAQNAWTVRLVPLQESVLGDVRQSLILLLGAVALVLVIGCVNIANLLLARASARGREMAVRQALGAARNRLVAQLLTESLLISLFGGFLGLLLLVCTKAFLLRMLPDSLPRLHDISMNWSVLLFALIVSLVSAVIFGLAPALHVGRADLTHGLKEEARGSTGSGEQARTRRALVVVEFALSLVLMICSGLLLRSFWDLLNVRPGFNSERVMSVRTWLPIPNDPSTDVYRTAAQESVLLREILRRGKTLPGVEEIAIGDAEAVPLGHGPDDLNPFPVILEGRETPRDQAPRVNGSRVTPQYLSVLGMTLLRGRLFADSDDDKSPQVVLINEAFARTYYPDSDPIGKRLMLPTPGNRSSLTPTTVIGVLANARTESLADATGPQIYFSLFQRTSKDLAIFVRGPVDIAATTVALREQVQSVDPELPVFGAQTLKETVSASLSQRRFAMQTIGLFALTALLLAGLGIYGVISFLVTERTHEIGIRLALGAQPGTILRMILRQGLQLAVAGAAIGVVCAFLVTRLMAGLLYGVRPADPVTFVAVALLLVAVALLACYIPARRAIFIDPLVALRYE